MAEAVESLGFDLADAFSSQTEFLADFFQGMGFLALEAVAEGDDFGFAGRKLVNDFFNSLSPEAGGGSFFGRSRFVRQEVPPFGSVVTYGIIQ